MVSVVVGGMASFFCYKLSSIIISRQEIAQNTKIIEKASDTKCLRIKEYLLILQQYHTPQLVHLLLIEMTLIIPHQPTYTVRKVDTTYDLAHEAYQHSYVVLT